MDPVTGLLIGSTAIGVLGSYFGYKSQKYQNQLAEMQAKAEFENNILATAEEQNAIVQNYADIRNYNLTQSPGGESFEASLTEGERIVGADISASQTSLILNKDVRDRTIKGLKDSTSMARTASLLEMVGTAVEGGTSISTYGKTPRLGIKPPKHTPRGGS